MIYLDYGATTWPKPQRVLEAMREALEAGNPGRGGHPVASRATRIVQETREALANGLGFPEPHRLVFTGNATDGLNMAIKGLVRPGDHVVMTALEHNAVVRPLRGLETSAGVEVSVVPFEEDGRVSPRRVAEAVLPGRTRLVAVTRISNVLGTIQPMGEISRAVRAVDDSVLVLMDGAQGAGLVSIDPEETGADVIAVTGHKNLYGPQGVGFLYVGPRVEEEIRPWREGGTGDGGERHPTKLPKKMEGGTPNLPGIAGLGAGLRYLAENGGADALLQHESRLAGLLCERVEKLSRVRLLSPSSPEAGIVTLVAEGISPAQLCDRLLEEFGIAARAGVHCAPLAHKQLGTWPEGALRLSVGSGTTEEEVDRAAEALVSLVG